MCALWVCVNVIMMVHSSVLIFSDKLFSLDELNQVMADFMFGLSEASSIPSLLLCGVF